MPAERKNTYLFFRRASKVFFVCLFLFLAVGGHILETGFVLKLNNTINRFFSASRNYEMTRLFVWITLLGKEQVIVIFSLLAIALFWIWNKRAYVLPLVVSVVGSQTLSSLGKIIFHRIRPLNGVYHENSFSFPSGHATVAVAFYGFLIYFFLRSSLRKERKIALVVPLSLLILLIGISRMYLGLHFLSDVLGGYLLGLGWLMTGIAFCEYIFYRYEAKEEQFIDIRKAKMITAAILVGGVVYYILMEHYFITHQTILLGKIIK